jgi:hypothetical protein
LSRRIPVQVNDLTAVVAVAAGNHYSLALKSDATLWAWGWNASGQLGDGTTQYRATATGVRGIPAVRLEPVVVNAAARNRDGDCLSSVNRVGRLHIQLRRTDVVDRRGCAIDADPHPIQHCRQLRALEVGSLPKASGSGKAGPLNCDPGAGRDSRIKRSSIHN